MGVKDLDRTQVAVLSIGVLTAAGFSLGAMFSYAGQIDTRSAGSGGDNFNASLPAQNYQEEDFGLEPREQTILAFNHDVVFVNAFYSTEDEREQLNHLEQLPDRFDDRVYVSIVSSDSGSDVLIQYGLTEFPSAVVVGGNQQYQSPPIRDFSNDRITKEVCDALRDLGGQAAQCL